MSSAKWRPSCLDLNVLKNPLEWYAVFVWTLAPTELFTNAVRLKSDVGLNSEIALHPWPCALGIYVT